MAEQSPILAEELARYSDGVLAVIHTALTSSESRNLVVSDGSYGGELDYLLAGDLWAYPQRLFVLLPPQERSTLSPNPTYQEIGSHWGRSTYLGHLKQKLGIDNEQSQYLHKVDARNLDSIHFYNRTNLPLVAYHALGCWVPVEGPGWGGEFITVGLTEAQLRTYSQQAGARFERDLYRSYPEHR